LTTERVERRLAAIVAADVAGYSRLMGADEEGTLAQLKAHRRELVDPKIAEHRGRTVKTTGDGMLVEFVSTVDAVRCAVEVQRGMVERNTDVPKDKRIEFRVGIHQGDIIPDGGDIFGDGVNVAARLEALAEPGGICVSARVREDARGMPDISFESAGEQQLKNIDRSVRVYRIRLIRPTTFARPTLPLPSKPSIAVLPFQNMSGDAEQEYFADGMVEDIITALSKLRWFFVIARNSTFAYRGKSPDVRQVARDLGVRYVLEGSVRAAGKRLRVIAQLIDAETGNHIWAERYDRDVNDVFAVQDDIVESIVASIEPQLYATEYTRSESTAPDSLDAWGAVTRAVWHLGRLAPDENECAREILEHTIKFSPKYAKAHSLLAFAQVRRVWFGTGHIDTCLPTAREHVKAALSIDGSDPWAFMVDALVKTLERKFDDAIAAFKSGIARNPNFAICQGYMALTLAMCGKAQDALAAVERAMRISPRDPYNVAFLHFAAISYFATEQYRESIEFDRRALRERPGFIIPLRLLAASNAMLDEMDEAYATVTELLRLQPNCSIRFVSSLPRYASDRDQERLISALRKAGLPE
jgi:adenylate cyclase